MSSKVYDLMTRVLLEHQLHLSELHPTNLSSSCKVDRVLTWTHHDFSARELFDSDLALRLITINLVRQQCGLGGIL